MAEHVWQLLSRPRVPGEDGYFEHLRAELVDLLIAPPRRFVEIGCGTGLTGAEVKRRYPAAVVDGIEYSPAAAAEAASRLDHVHAGDVGQMDLGALYEPGSIDALLLADVLEHLYDPWNLLVRVRPFLAPGAQVIASIPNVRNLALLRELAAGAFSYVPAGLLDVTHIRFFTRAEILRMFDQTGYEVTWVGNVRDPRIPDIAVTAFPVNLEAGDITIKVSTAETLTELMTIQFYVRAQPRANVQSGPTPTGGGSGT
jgi:2-polyprenyl-3-methyl-5-hydroxy-6-metoxy-1,4-benzoquinol methylase